MKKTKYFYWIFFKLNNLDTDEEYELYISVWERIYKKREEGRAWGQRLDWKKVWKANSINEYSAQ